MKEGLNLEDQSLLNDEKLEGITGGGGGYGYGSGEGRDPNSQYSATRCLMYNTASCPGYPKCGKWGTSNCVDGFEKL